MPYVKGKGSFRGEGCRNPAILKDNDTASRQFCKKFEPQLIEQDDIIICEHFC